MNRKKEITKVSIIGIIVNFLLVGFKAMIGFLSGSIAIILDAVNNLSDALSSIITIIGTALAGKKPDKKHPYGYGKIEYFSSLFIAIIIFGTGITSFYESFKKILNPTAVEYSKVMLVIIASGVLVKAVLGRFVKKRGEKLNSDSLVASGKDAMFDAIISASTLLGALILYFAKFNIDGYVGVIISIFVIKAGLEIIIESFDSLIGNRIDSELSTNIKAEINQFEKVNGSYDLALHQYGPEDIIGSVHIEVDDDVTARELHMLTRKITEHIFEKFGVILTVGIYASNNLESKSHMIKAAVRDIAATHDTFINLHGFYLDEDKKTISFDVVFDFKEKRKHEIRDEIVAIMKEKYPEYEVRIIIDNDYSD